MKEYAHTKRDSEDDERRGGREETCRQTDHRAYRHGGTDRRYENGEEALETHTEVRRKVAPNTRTSKVYGKRKAAYRSGKCSSESISTL